MLAATMEAHFLLAKHCLLFALLIAAAFTDLRTGKVYNWCTMPAMFLGLLLSYIVGGAWSGNVLRVNLVSNLLGAGVGFGVFIFPYLKGGISAGDVKLATALGAVGGLSRFYIIYALFYGAIVGALVSVLVLLWHGKFRQGLKGSFRFLVSLEPRRADATGASPKDERTNLTIPYSAAVAVGGVIAWFATELQGLAV